MNDYRDDAYNIDMDERGECLGDKSSREANVIVRTFYIDNCCPFNIAVCIRKIPKHGELLLDYAEEGGDYWDGQRQKRREEERAAAKDAAVAKAAAGEKEVAVGEERERSEQALQGKQKELEGTKAETQRMAQLLVRNVHKVDALKRVVATEVQQKNRAEAAAAEERVQNAAVQQELWRKGEAHREEGEAQRLRAEAEARAKEEAERKVRGGSRVKRARGVGRRRAIARPALPLPTAHCSLRTIGSDHPSPCVILFHLQGLAERARLSHQFTFVPSKQHIWACPFCRGQVRVLSTVLRSSTFHHAKWYKGLCHTSSADSSSAS
jgi:hypothetical protein